MIKISAVPNNSEIKCEWHFILSEYKNSGGQIFSGFRHGLCSFIFIELLGATAKRGRAAAMTLAFGSMTKLF